MSAKSPRGGARQKRPASVGPGQMQRITDATATAIESLGERHGMPRNLLMERIVLWVSELDHEAQQLILGTISPDRSVAVAQRIASRYAEN